MIGRRGRFWSRPVLAGPIVLSLLVACGSTSPSPTPAPSPASSTVTIKGRLLTHGGLTTAPQTYSSTGFAPEFGDGQYSCFGEGKVSLSRGQTVEEDVVCNEK